MRFRLVLDSTTSSRVHDVIMQEWFFWNPNCISSGMLLALRDFSRLGLRTSSRSLENAEVRVIPL